MSAHTCTSLTHGCFRCDLHVDELRAHLAEMRSEVIGINSAIEVLKDHRHELTDSIQETCRAVDTWDMFDPTAEDAS